MDVADMAAAGFGITASPRLAGPAHASTSPVARRPLHLLRLRPPSQHRTLPRMRQTDQFERERNCMSRRRPFTLVSALSLLLCMATVVLWIRSYQKPLWHHWSGGRETSLMNYCGEVDWYEVWWMPSAALPSMTVADGYTCSELDPAVGLKERTALLVSLPTLHRVGPVAGIGAFWEQPFRFTEIMLPHWLLVLVCAVLPMVWVAQQVRVRTAQRMGRCIHCGYDLRASKDRCPECGRLILLPRKATA